jgi:hypothetical protein
MKDITTEVGTGTSVGKSRLPYMRVRVPSNIAKGILEILPDMIAPLVWMRNGSHWAGGYGCVVRKFGGVYMLTVRNSHDREFETLEQAQAAANTHHRDAIMAAFTGETTT